VSIDLDAVAEVLLVDGWHAVAPRAPAGFVLAPYAFRAGDAAAPGTSDGFILVEQVDTQGNQHVIAGPLSSVLAVRYKIDKQG
jgi:hypothetical protein